MHWNKGDRKGKEEEEEEGEDVCDGERAWGRISYREGVMPKCGGEIGLLRGGLLSPHKR